MSENFTGIVAVETPEIRAGIAFYKGRISKAPPSLLKMEGWPLNQFEEFASRRGWKIRRLRES